RSYITRKLNDKESVFSPRDRVQPIPRQDVRMGDGSDRFRFPLEAFAQQRSASERGRENLDGNSAVETAVACLVDFTHAARPDWRHNFIRTEPSARRNRHVGDARL